MAVLPAFEVETRLHFAAREEAFRLLPFLRSCLDRELIWETHLHGLDLFRRGELLRLAGGHTPGGEDRFLLGWKGPDHGSFANIREEIDEEITHGIADSAVLAKLGGGAAAASPAEAAAALTRLGHVRFRTFSGRSLLGVYEPLGLHLKLMHCPILKWPLMLEIEKTAGDAPAAAAAEREIEGYVRAWGLTDRVVREEPPALFVADR
ncbi:MAG: hypothetical protein ACM3ZC_14015 [Bacteroidota bacterium]